MNKIMLAGLAVVVVALLAVGAAFGLSSGESGSDQADAGRTQDMDGGMPSYEGREPSLEPSQDGREPGLAPAPDLKEIEPRLPVAQDGPQTAPAPRPEMPVTDGKPDEPVSSDGNSSSPLVPPDRQVPPQPGGGTQPYTPPQAPSGDRQVVPAPIDGLDVLTLESYPAQYLVKVQAGLPSGCAQKHGHEVSRQGAVITISVTNTLPKDAVPCTMIYGMYELNINLGSDFQSGVTYTVKVNDETVTFKAQ